MDLLFSAANTAFVTTSGSGVIGITGKPVYLQSIYNAQGSSQSVSIFGFSGGTAVTMAFVTLAARSYNPFPAAGASGITYQTASNPGDADLRLVFFWLPGSST